MRKTKKEIKIAFTDLVQSNGPWMEYFKNLLKDNFNIKICDDNPDYLFYSVFDNKHHEYDCVKIFSRAKMLSRILIIAIMLSDFIILILKTDICVCRCGACIKRI